MRRTVPQAGLRPPSMWLSQVGCRSAPWATSSCERPRASLACRIACPRASWGSVRGAMPATVAGGALYSHRVELKYHLGVPIRKGKQAMKKTHDDTRGP